MAIERAREYLKKFGLDKKIIEFNVSSATVALAAKALHTDEARIAKSITFENAKGGTILIVTAGDMKIDNHKFKDTFGFKAKMLTFQDVEQKVGHSVGGVCPFGINDGVSVFIDSSLKRFDTVFPACGSSNSCIELTVLQLQNTAQNFAGIVDLCKPVAPKN